MDGLGKTSRERLTCALMHSRGTIKAAGAGAMLDMPQKRAAEALARLAKAGWLKRTKRGVYLPIPLDSNIPGHVVEEPWILASEIFSPCYISGWSAAEYWNLTEQIFESIVIVTGKPIRSRDQKISGIRYILRKMDAKKHFGLERCWIGQYKVMVADPSRMIIDILNDPSIGGGIWCASDFLGEYFRSEHANPDLLIDYAKQLGNRTVFKRLGFLLEWLGCGNQNLIEVCAANISKGYSEIEPGLPGEAYVRRWRLHVHRFMLEPPRG